MAETCRKHPVFITEDTLTPLYAFFGFVSIPDQLNAWSFII